MTTKRILIRRKDGVSQHYNISVDNERTYTKTTAGYYIREPEPDEEPDPDEYNDIMEIHIYGALVDDADDEYALIEATIYAPYGTDADDILEYMNEKHIYSTFKKNGSGKPSLDNRVTIAGEHTYKQHKVSTDWKKAIDDAIDSARMIKDKHGNTHTRERKTVRANRNNKQQYAQKEIDFYDDYED